MRALRSGRALAIAPVAVFVVAFGVSFAVHSSDDSEPPATPSSAGGEERIVVSVREGEGAAYLWVVSVDGSDAVQITRAPSADATAADASPAWSPDGDWIAFSRQVVDRSGQPTRPRLYLVAPDGSTLRQLTSGDAFDIAPAWSPDSSRVLFGRLVGETTTDLFTVRLDGGGIVRLTDDPRRHEDLAGYSPDGQRIAYTSVRRDEDIWVMNADGSGKELLLGGRPPDGLPAWSPDGRRIAFVHAARIAVMNADGSNARVLGPKGTHPQWSPDGTRILFTGDPDGIFVMNADGSGLARVPIEGQAAGASWEPAP